MTNTEKQFVQVLRAAIAGGDLPGEADWPGVWNLAVRHHLEVMVWKAARKDASLPDFLKKRMEDSYNRMAAREIRQTHCLELIEEALGDAGIHYAV